MKKIKVIFRGLFPSKTTKIERVMKRQAVINQAFDQTMQTVAIRAMRRRIERATRELNKVDPK